MRNLVVLIAVAFAVSPGMTFSETLGELGPFGIGSCHVNNRTAKDSSRWIPQMESIGLKNFRACAVSWPALEPVEGQWEWEKLDEQMDYLTAHGFQFGGMLIGSPVWNKKDQPGSLPVNNLPGWSNYVSKVVEHSRGRVKLWEVWNEPPNFTGKGQTPADYAKIVVSAYEAAKAADPECLVGLAAKSVHISYLEKVIAAGAKDHFDYITLHPYEVLNGISDNAGSESLFMHIVPTVRKMLAARNPSKLDVPILFTELGCDLKNGADVQAHVLVKAYAMSIAQGVACVHWFEGRDGDSGPLGLLDAKGTPRPAYLAMGQMIQHLGQYPEYLGWVLLKDQHVGFVFQGKETTILVAWARSRSSEVVEFGQVVEIVDPLTGDSKQAENHDLSPSPILVVGVPAALLRRARGNKGLPLPWGGDFSQAKSVSITMGDDGEEKGLHTRSGEAVARAVIGYGGSARSGSVPGGNLYIVDPEFMSYTTEPIEITAVVRRNESNDKAGFKLVYESRDGFKTTGGWYTVPDNKKWHTVSWKIDDPQFVGYWGYHFSLVSDGDVYNKYYIQSVKVTKTTK